MRHLQQNPFNFSALLLIVFLCFTGLSQASPPTPFIDRASSFFSNLWSHVLDQIPSALEKVESLTLSSPRVDWKETPESHVIMLDMPGLKEEEIKIEFVEDQNLRVSGERKREEEKKKWWEKWHKVERSYGKFLRQFKVPENVDFDSVKAKLKERVLTLSLAKLSPDKIKKPRQVFIDGGGGEKSSKLARGKAKQGL